MYGVDDLFLYLINTCLVFQTWQLRGKYPNRGFPKIFKDETVGPEAKKLYNEATALMKRIIKEKLLRARGIVTIYPANSVGDDIEVIPCLWHCALTMPGLH
jgi:cobalamin-dependent methionine synthase I